MREDNTAFKNQQLAVDVPEFQLSRKIEFA